MKARKQLISWALGVALQIAMIGAGQNITPVPYETYYEPDGETIVLLLNEHNQGYFRCITLGDQVRPDFADFADGDYVRAFTAYELLERIVQTEGVNDVKKQVRPNGYHRVLITSIEGNQYIADDERIVDAMAKAFIDFLENN